VSSCSATIVRATACVQRALSAQPTPRRRTPGDANPSVGYPRVSRYLLYEDAAGAVEHLEPIFGFELRRSEIGSADRTHYEVSLGEDGLVTIDQAGVSMRHVRVTGAVRIRRAARGRRHQRDIQV